MAGNEGRSDSRVCVERGAPVDPGCPVRAASAARTLCRRWCASKIVWKNEVASGTDTVRLNFLNIFVGKQFFLLTKSENTSPTIFM